MIKALKSLGHEVDVLVGTLPDDFGADLILANVVGSDSLYRDLALRHKYDVAIMSMPFDGRWKNGQHFFADSVMDGFTRPDPTTTGLVSWKKHEIEYQMENAYAIGYKGEIPDCSFLNEQYDICNDSDKIYLGIGYKKDALGYWARKHWGNKNFATLVKMLLGDAKVRIVCTGDYKDLSMTMAPIYREVRDPRFMPQTNGLLMAIGMLTNCGIYVGNDTGMMHVAAALGKKVVAYFNIENAITKSRPWCEHYTVFDGTQRTVNPEDMYNAVQEFRK